MFQLHAVDAREVVMLCGQLRRKQVLPFLTRLSPFLVGNGSVRRELLLGARDWQARPSRAPNESTPGGTVRKEQQERPQRRGGDLRSREPAFDEICTGQEYRSAGPAVAPRVRSQLIHSRTALANEIRGLLGEYGISISKELRVLRRALPLILEDRITD